jgi:hypothetical protein
MVQSVSRSEFLTQMSTAVEQLELGNGNSGTIKLKFWFLTDSSSCLKAVGFHGLTLNDSESAFALLHQMPNLNICTPGQQKHQAQNCEGIVFLSIEHGKIEKSRIANFSFSSN